jgi:hypothetical protein
VGHPRTRSTRAALQNAGLAIIAVEKVDEAPPPADPRSVDKSRLRAELEALVDEADESELARLEEAVTVSPDDGLDETFWGPAPDSVTAAEAVVADLTEQFAQRRDLAANSIGREAAAELLGISPQSVTDKLESRKLVGIKVGREWRLPRWQFDPDNTTGALPDLNVLQTAFPGGPVSLSRPHRRPRRRRRAHRRALTHLRHRGVRAAAASHRNLPWRMSRRLSSRSSTFIRNRIVSLSRGR